MIDGDVVLPGYTAIVEKFAAPMYYMLYAMLGDTSHELEDCALEDHKDAILPFSPNAITIRKALQTLGTEWGRDVCGDGIWANLLCARIDNVATRYAETRHFAPFFIVSDNRFVNEALAVREAFSRVFSIYIHRQKSTPQMQHRSEQEIELLAKGADFIVSNDGTIEELKEKINDILIEIGNRI